MIVPLRERAEEFGIRVENSNHPRFPIMLILPTGTRVPCHSVENAEYFLAGYEHALPHLSENERLMQQAVHWHTKLDHETQEVRQQLKAWLLADPRHMEAFNRISEMGAQLSALDPET